MPSSGRQVITTATAQWRAGVWRVVKPPRVVPRATPTGEVVLCPSYPSEQALGPIFRVSEAGTEWLDGPLSHNATNDEGGSALRVRYAGVCHRGACIHWAGACQLGIGVASSGTDEADEPSCSIISRCRWRLENGGSVCGPCQLLTRLM